MSWGYSNGQIEVCFRCYNILWIWTQLRAKHPIHLLFPVQDYYESMVDWSYKGELTHISTPAAKVRAFSPQGILRLITFLVSLSRLLFLIVLIHSLRCPDELYKFVDEGMDDDVFIDAVSNIVSRGCHVHPCTRGAVTSVSFETNRPLYGIERRMNFKNILVSKWVACCSQVSTSSDILIAYLPRDLCLNCQSKNKLEAVPRHLLMKSTILQQKVLKQRDQHTDQLLIHRPSFPPNLLHLVGRLVLRQNYQM